MKTIGIRHEHAPILRGTVLNQQSPHFAGLCAAWVGVAGGYTSVFRELVNGQDATPLGVIDTNYGWQESDSGFLGTGTYQPGSGANGWDAGNDARIQVAATGLTVCVWVRLYQNLGSTSWPGLIGKGDADSTTAGSWILYMPNTAKISWLMWSGSARANNITSTSTLDFQGHYHFAATWLPSTRTSLFVNGVREATTTTSVPATLDNPVYNVLIGSNQGGTNKSKYPFRGNIYEARIYNRALSDEEIYQLYAAPTRWSLYRSPARILGLGVSAAAGRVQGPALQMI